MNPTTFRGILFLIAGATVGAGTATLGADKPFKDHYQPDVAVTSVTIGQCEAEGCLMFVQKTAVPLSQADSKEVGGPVSWTERLKIPADSVLNMLHASCVVDDGPRPTAFAQELPLCPTATVTPE